jgi:hypothetical protein
VAGAAVDSAATGSSGDGPCGGAGRSRTIAQRALGNPAGSRPAGEGRRECRPAGLVANGGTTSTGRRSVEWRTPAATRMGRGRCPEVRCRRWAPVGRAGAGRRAQRAAMWSIIARETQSKRPDVGSLTCPRSRRGPCVRAFGGGAGDEGERGARAGCWRRGGRSGGRVRAVGWRGRAPFRRRRWGTTCLDGGVIAIAPAERARVVRAGHFSRPRRSAEATAPVRSATPSLL